MDNSSMNQCPHCHTSKNQVKNGFTQSGSQIYKCKLCNRKYTPRPKSVGHSLETKQMAIRLVLDGNSQRQAARHVGVAPQSIANWLAEYHASLPTELPVQDEAVEVAEQDELFTFVGNKKRSSTL